MKTLDPRGGGGGGGISMDPRGLIGRTCVSDHQKLLNIEVDLKASMKIFKVLFNKFVETLDPKGRASLKPMDLIGRINEGDH